MSDRNEKYINKLKDELKNNIYKYADDMCFKLGICNNIMIDAIALNIFSSIDGKLPSQIGCDTLNVLDVNEKQHEVSVYDTSTLSYEALLAMSDIRSKGLDIDIRDVLLHSDKRYIVIGESARPVFDIDIKVAKFIQNECPLELLSDLVSEHLNIGIKLYADTINVLKQYIDKAYKISTAKHLVLSSEYTEQELNNRNFELSYIIKNTLRSTYDELVSYKSRHKNETKKVAYGNNISWYDLVYRLQQGISLDKAVKLGIEEREKYNLHYYEEYSGRTFASYKNADNLKEIVVNIIAEKIQNQST